MGVFFNLLKKNYLILEIDNKNDKKQEEEKKVKS